MEITSHFALFAGEDAQEGGRPPTLSLSDTSSLSRIENKTYFFQGIFSNISLLPPPPAYFLGYTLPPGHPCNSFTLPPPPADKKRTGPRRKFLASPKLF